MQRIVFTARMQRCSTFKASFAPPSARSLFLNNLMQGMAVDVQILVRLPSLAHSTPSEIARTSNNDPYFAAPLEIGSTENKTRVVIAWLGTCGTPLIRRSLHVDSFCLAEHRGLVPNVYSIRPGSGYSHIRVDLRWMAQRAAWLGSISCSSRTIGST